MDYNPNLYNARRPLDEKEKTLLSPHQQMLYNRGINAQIADRGFAEADQRLSSILPSASGLFVPLTGHSAQAMLECFQYIEDIQDNKGPTALMLRKLARIDDHTASKEQGVAVQHHSLKAEQTIKDMSPKIHPAGHDLATAFRPYLDYSEKGEINLCAKHPIPDPGSPNDGGPVLESVDELLASRDTFHTSNRGWFVTLNCHEHGGSASKMYFEGGMMSSIRYRGAAVYNNLEEDYYSTTRYPLSQSELEHRLKLLFTHRGWTAESHDKTTLSPEAFAEEVKSMLTAWKPFNFFQMRLSRTEENLGDDDDDYSYRDRLPHVTRHNEHSVPESLSALGYSASQTYMEWVTNLAKQAIPELIAEDAPESFFQDQHLFRGQWKINSNNTIYVRGSFETGEIELSRNHKFEEERYQTDVLTLTDSSRYVLAQWLRTSRMMYLNEVLSWFHRTRVDPPQYLLDAKVALNPESSDD